MDIVTRTEYVVGNRKFATMREAKRVVKMEFLKGEYMGWCRDHGAEVGSFENVLLFLEHHEERFQEYLEALKKIEEDERLT